MTGIFRSHGESIRGHAEARPSAQCAALLKRVEALEKFSHKPFDFTHLMARLEELEKRLKLRGEKL